MPNDILKHKKGRTLDKLKLGSSICLFVDPFLINLTTRGQVESDKFLQPEKFNLRHLKCKTFIPFLSLAPTVFYLNLRMLILSCTVSGTLFKLPNTFTLGINQKLRKI